MVYHTPSQPVPCDLLRFSHITKYVCFHFKYDWPSTACYIDADCWTANIAFRNYILSLASHSASSDAKVHQRLSLYFLTIAGVVFRSEIAVLVAAETLFLLLARQASLLETIIPAGTAGLIMGLLISVPIDSFFWQEYPMWSELSGFYYNTVLGKSSDWGVSPWHFYFSSALPRLLLNPFTYALMFAAVASPATRARALAVLAPCLGFVAAYSLLPHKEWRFIVYAVPPLTAVAGVGASWVWARRAKTALYRVLSLALVGSALASLAASAALLAVSRLNYPGGAAVVRLREIAAAEPASVRVFADNLVCQTGLTRFLEARGQTVPGTRAPKWVFDKTENQTALLDPLFWHNFDYVLAEHPERIIGAWEVVDVVNGFAGIEIVGPGSEDVVESADNGHELLKRVETLSKKYVTKGWWVRVRMDQKVNILKRQDEAEVLKGAKSVETL